MAVFPNQMRNSSLQINLLKYWKIIRYCPDIITLSKKGYKNEPRKISKLEAEICPIKKRPFLATKDPIFRELLCHPLIVSLWHRYLGEDMICSSWSGITLHPNHASVSWHVDYPYWSIKAPYPTWNLSAQVIWMLDDFTEENGATGAIPGSHRYQMPPSYGKNEFPLEARILTGKRGSAIVANCAYWHTARPNLTQKSRSALVGTYIRSFCIPCTDLRWQLDKLDNPTDLERQLLGGNQFCPKGENMF